MGNFVDKCASMEFITDLFGTVAIGLNIIVYMFQWQTFLLIRVDAPTAEDDPTVVSWDDMPQEIKKFRFWVQLEILLILCITIANFLFLLTRSVKRNEFELEF